MTEQEQFEADYLAAVKLYDKVSPLFWVSAANQYSYTSHQAAFEVWQQQAARHKAEIVELVNALRDAHDMLERTSNRLVDAVIEHPPRNSETVCDLLGIHDCEQATTIRLKAKRALAKYEEKQ